jgi:hemolysin III
MTLTEPAGHATWCRSLPDMAAVTLAPAQLPKPRWRGWIHFWAFFCSLIAGTALVTAATLTASASVAVATAVYSATVSGVFGVSALYHRRRWATRRGLFWIRRLDHSMIFVFIAGSYTPFAVLAMPPRTGTIVLWVVWGGALAGVALKLLWPGAPRRLSVPIYLVVGWVAAFVLPDLLAYCGPGIFTLLILGGALYTSGAVVYALRKPDPWPSTFGFHEVFHATTVLAAICHYIAVWLTIYTV